ncbi:hypothetical protein BGX21_005141 [Mortierella sp. AD011]|nr:hypothetical protein BGX20_008382 [Mortierella sp. AD010]KAF9400033.1 hypothetical protein BGX21_005141 [Mortierella sp. AD011]
MNRSHSYSKVPISDANDDENSVSIAPSNSNVSSGGSGSIPVMLANLSRFPSSASGYARVETEDFDNVDKGKENVMVRRMSYPPSSVHITVDPSTENAGSSSSSSSATAAASASTTEAQPSRPQFPAAASARRMIQQTMDGVFSNLSARPRVEQPRQEELPPPYKAAALDQTPAYYETTVMENGLSGDQVLVDGLPVGGILGLFWTCLLSTSFQFLGFFLTYLLHTSHATKTGSKMGLGMTFISIGQQMLSGDSEDPDPDADTGYMGDTGEIPKSNEYMWVSCFMLFMGSVIILHSGYEFIKVKRRESAILAASRQSEEAEISNVMEIQVMPSQLEVISV